jgi:hypothetical protein
MNEVSSRSHAVFIVIVEQEEHSGNEAELQVDVIDEEGKPSKSDSSFKVGKLNLVDLAGSERVAISGATGTRLEESKKINQSLSSLGNVISALTDPSGSRSHIPYRNSKLTRILEDSLGGNCKTTMMAMISPAQEAFNETVSTVKFANRAKNIKNEAHVNEDLDQRALLRKYERELKRLRSELEARSKNVVDKRKLLELEEQRKRAEQDKMAALMNMDQLSKELMLEKAQKQKLEMRIKEMDSQLLVGGHTVQDTLAFKQALKQEQDRIRQAYEQKVAELEKEKEDMEEEKVQTHRFKQLLLKQRDIMIQLTARLNERDQSILLLQEELEAYDSHQRMMEDALDQKTATLINLQKGLLAQNPNSVSTDDLTRGLLDKSNNGATSVSVSVPSSLASSRAPSIPGTPSSTQRGSRIFSLNALPARLQLLAGNAASAGNGGAGLNSSTSAGSAYTPGSVSGQFASSRSDGSNFGPGFAGSDIIEPLPPSPSHSSGSSISQADSLYDADSRSRRVNQALSMAVGNGSNKTSSSVYSFDTSGDTIGNTDSSQDAKVQELLNMLKAKEAENRQLQMELLDAQKARTKTETSQISKSAEVKDGDESARTEDAKLLAKELELKKSLIKGLQEQNRSLSNELQLRKNEQRQNQVSTNEVVLEKVLGEQRKQHTAELKEIENTLGSAQKRLSVQEKERAALRVILESKMKTLIDSISASVAKTPAQGSSSNESGGLSPKTRRNIDVLQRLVDASVMALKHADNALNANAPLVSNTIPTANINSNASIGSNILPTAPTSGTSTFVQDVQSTARSSMQGQFKSQAFVASSMEPTDAMNLSGTGLPPGYNDNASSFVTSTNQGNIGISNASGSSVPSQSSSNVRVGTAPTEYSLGKR